MKSFRTTLIILFTLLAGSVSNGQIAKANPHPAEEKTTNISPTHEDSVYPEFIGGDEALIAYVNNNLKYPKSGIRKGHEGTVILSYFVATDGSIENITVKQSVCKELDKAAIQLVKEMPAWKPATFNNRVVRAKYSLPVTFELTF